MTAVTHEPVRDAQRSKAQLLEAATQVFASRGFEATRVDEIAEQAGLNKRLVYYYFGDKASLHRAVLDDAEAQLQVECAADLKQTLVRALRMLCARPALANLLNSEVRALGVTRRARESALYSAIRHGMHLPAADALYRAAVQLAALDLLRGSTSSAQGRRVDLAADFLMAALA